MCMHCYFIPEVMAEIHNLVKNNQELLLRLRKDTTKLGVADQKDKGSYQSNADQSMQSYRLAYEPKIKNSGSMQRQSRVRFEN
jgi:hypothetical protein